MKILNRAEIEKLLSIPDVLKAIEEGFVMEAVVPPPTLLHFERGECHIKYGYAKAKRYYVIKVASSFDGAPDGLILLFDKETGQPICLLQDQGYLTEIRTAAAGYIAAKYLAPKNVKCIGIVGTGAQAYHQLQLLAYATQCRKVMIWGRDPVKAEKLKERLCDWDVQIAMTLDELTAECNLIVTTTSARSPLLFAHQIRSGTHITAVGADDHGKQELDPHIFAKADRVVVDSREQCSAYGDTSHAIKAGLISEMNELEEVITKPHLRRSSDSEITVADLTGVAIQDLQIATQVFEYSR